MMRNIKIVGHLAVVAGTVALFVGLFATGVLLYAVATAVLLSAPGKNDATSLLRSAKTSLSKNQEEP